MLFHDSNDTQFILFGFCCSFFSQFEKSLWNSHSAWQLYHAFITWHSGIYSHLCKAVRSISAKLAIPFCLPSVYLLICFLMPAIPMWKLTNPTHYTRALIYGEREKNNWMAFSLCYWNQWNPNNTHYKQRITLLSKAYTVIHISEMGVCCNIGIKLWLLQS